MNNLTNAGYLVKKSETNKIIYSANKNHPLFEVLQSIVRKHLGIEDIINQVLFKIGKIEKIILLGDYAKGIDSGIIDVLIVGKDINKKYLDDINLKIEKEIKRKVNFLISNTGISQSDNLVVFEA